MVAVLKARPGEVGEGRMSSRGVAAWHVALTHVRHGGQRTSEAALRTQGSGSQIRQLTLKGASHHSGCTQKEVQPGGVGQEGLPGTAMLPET